MNRDEIRSSVGRVFEEVFEEESFEFSESLSRDNLKSWDSLGHIRLVTAMEEAFDIRFTLEEIEQLTSAGRIVDYICARH
jgi:acyl carrier protein